MQESIFVVASIAVFAVIGMLAGWVHGHGEIAGTICGGLGGLILAIVVPRLFGTAFMTTRKALQYAVAVIALVSQIVIICLMYDVDLSWPFTSSLPAGHEEPAVVTPAKADAPAVPPLKPISENRASLGNARDNLALEFQTQFASSADVKALYPRADSWLEFEFDGSKYMFCQHFPIPFVSVPIVSLDGWILAPYMKGWTRIYAVQIRQTFTKMIFDSKTGRFSLRGTVNNEFNGVDVVSFDLRAT